MRVSLYLWLNLLDNKITFNIMLMIYNNVYPSEMRNYDVEYDWD